MEKPFYKENEDLYLRLYIQPNAKQDKVIGLYQGYLKVQMMAPATENKANAHLMKWLSKEFRLAPSRISIKKGEQSRYKLICIESPSILPTWLSFEEK